MPTEEEILKAFENEIALAQRQNAGVQQMGQIYGTNQKQNLVEWELDFKSELEDIGHSLRCDLIRIDKDGNQYWTSNDNKDKVFLNEVGVNDVLRKIILLVNKNKVLSNYTIEEIKERLQMIGHEIRVLIYNNYEFYGIDNEYKMNNYSGIVMDILGIIEDAFRRALAGETHKGLNEQRLVTQNESVSPQQQYPMMMQQQKKSKWYNPLSWNN